MKPKSIHILALLLLALGALPAMATTVSLTGGTLTHPSPTSNWQYTQNGFVIDIQGASNHPTLLSFPPDLSVISSDGNYSVAPSPNPTVGITVSHGAGKTFGLKALNIPSVYSGVEMSVFRDFASGAFEYHILPTFYRAVSISAVKADGSTISQTFSPWCADTGTASSGPTFGVFSGCSQDRNTVFDWRDFGSGFNAIKSFTIDVLNPFEVFPNVSVSGSDPAALQLALQESVICSPLNVNRFDPKFDVANICNGSTLLHPGGSWSFSAGFLGGLRNDAAFISIDTMHLAPIPVPASLPLLAGGIGLLGLFRRRAQRRASVTA